jgi:hypothetical protein
MGTCHTGKSFCAKPLSSKGLSKAGINGSVIDTSTTHTAVTTHALMGWVKWVNARASRCRIRGWGVMFCLETFSDYDDTETSLG